MFPKKFDEQKQILQNQNSRPYIFVSIFVILCLAGVVVINYLNQRQSPTNTNTQNNNSNLKSEITTLNESKPPEIVKIKPTQIRLNTMFIGDVFWGRYIDDWAKASDLKYANPFEVYRLLNQKNTMCGLPD